MVKCKTTDCQIKPCQTTRVCNKRGICTFGNQITNLDNNLIPKGAYTFTVKRQRNKLLQYVQNNSKLLFQTYNFYQALKFAYNLCGNNKTGCCYKMLWKTQGNTRFVSFKEQVDLYRYLIYNNRSSNLYYYIKVTLGSLQNLNVAKSMIGNSKFFPYQILIKNRKVKNGCCQNGYNLLNYKDPSNGGKYTNEYIRWLKENKIFNPYS